MGKWGAGLEKGRRTVDSLLVKNAGTGSGEVTGDGSDHDGRWVGTRSGPKRKGDGRGRKKGRFVPVSASPGAVGHGGEDESTDRGSGGQSCLPESP